ncbi:MAG TPA: hypothetical protein VF974_02925 [Patescibacteria group bacterium]
MGNSNDPIFKVPEINPADPAHRNWFVRHILAEVLGIAVVIALGATAYYWQATSSPLPKFEPVKHKQNSTANWKTYTNTEYGFSFKYPNDFNVYADDPTFIQIIRPKDPNKITDNMTIRVWDNKANLSVIDWWNKYGPYAPPRTSAGLKPDTFPIKDIMVVDVKGVFIEGSEGVLANYLILPADKNKILEINLMMPTNQIISTFKFITTPPGNPLISSINSFAKCAAAGYPIMQSYPEQCKTPDGLTFVKPEGVCIQVMAQAKNPVTGEIREFPTPCDIPVGWQKTSS